MGRKKQPPEELEPDETAGGKSKRYSVTIDQDLVKKLRFLATAAEQSPPDWVNNKIRQIIEKEWPPLVSELRSE